MYKVVSVVQNDSFGAIYRLLSAELKESVLQFNTVAEYLNLMSALKTGRGDLKLYLTKALLICIVENTAQGCPMARYSAIARLARTDYLSDNCKEQVPGLLLGAFKGVLIGAGSDLYNFNVDVDGYEAPPCSMILSDQDSSAITQKINESRTIEGVLILIDRSDPRLVDIAVMFAKLGDLDLALRAANKIHSRFSGVFRCLGSIAKIVAENGDVKRALEIVNNIGFSYNYDKSLDLREIAKIVAEKGDIEWALEIANKISVKKQKSACSEYIEQLKVKQTKS